MAITDSDPNSELAPRGGEGDSGGDGGSVFIMFFWIIDSRKRIKNENKFKIDITRLISERLYYQRRRGRLQRK